MKDKPDFAELGEVAKSLIDEATHSHQTGDVPQAYARLREAVSALRVALAQSGNPACPVHGLMTVYERSAHPMNLPRLKFQIVHCTKCRGFMAIVQVGAITLNTLWTDSDPY